MRKPGSTCLRGIAVGAALALWPLELVGVTPPKTTSPVWLVPAETGKATAMTLDTEARSKVRVDTSNNNLAIAIHDGRLYFAFRSATHHHPKPPVWAPQYLQAGDATTRLYVLSAPVDASTWANFETAVPALPWRLELEVNERLREAVFLPQIARLQNSPTRNDAMRWFRESLGEETVRELIRRVPASSTPREPASVQADFASLLGEFDLREPFFLQLGGELHFYFQHIEGKSMAFNTLRTWHMKLGRNGWGVPEPVLKPKEHFWDIQVRREGAREVAYLSSYSGSHYVINREGAKNLVHFRRSTDGVRWEPVEGKEHVYQGGASEAAFLFAPGSPFMWIVMRLDDGDERGWGALIGKADLKSLSNWVFPAKADPRRFDSPRLFAHGGEVYLLARQNLCAGPNGVWDEKSNCPFDRAFVGTDELTAQKKREGIFGRIRKKLMSFKEVTARLTKDGNVDLGDNPGVSLQYEYTYYFDLAKRTALYRLNPQTGSPEHVLTFPSSGDTAFPSLVKLSETEYLLANYTSPLQNPAWSWREGQQNRTGIYVMKLTFPSPKK